MPNSKFINFRTCEKCRKLYKRYYLPRGRESRICLECREQVMRDKGWYDSHINYWINYYTRWLAKFARRELNNKEVFAARDIVTDFFRNKINKDESHYKNIKNLKQLLMQNYI